jgi:putative tryptophan/tyrosine transport system substrate-binding protein
MRRRRFLLAAPAIIGGIALPLSAQGQETRPRRPYRVGVLQSGSFAVPFIKANFDALVDGLRAYGDIEGRNVVVERRSADGDSKRLPDAAAALVAGNTQSVLAAKRATSTIPIVMLGTGDPVGAGIVDSLARPSGNITGLSQQTTDLTAKRLKLLTEVKPGLSRIAVLRVPNNASHPPMLREAEIAAKALRIDARVIAVHEPQDLRRVVDEAVADGAEALLPFQDQAFARLPQLAEIVAARQLPSIYSFMFYARVGGLLTYGVDIAAIWRQGAAYVHKILTGTKLAELPIEQPTGFGLAINLKTARALGLELPQSILLRADEAIE